MPFSDIARTQLEINKLVKAMPRVYGQMAVNHYRDNFRRQGFMDRRLVRWKPRKGDSRVFFNLSKGVNAQRKKMGVDTGRAVLVKSGKLRRAIRVKSVSGKRVVIHNTMKYAAIHNDGGTITQTITAKQRKFFWAKFYETGDPVWKARALRKGNVKIEMPKRQFMGNSWLLNRRFENEIKRRVESAWNR